MSSEEEVQWLGKFVSAFKRGIEREVAAMHTSSEAFELTLAGGEDLGSLRYDFELPTLAVAPWFLYERLVQALDGLDVDRHSVSLALTLFGKRPHRRVSTPLRCDHEGLNERVQRTIGRSVFDVTIPDPARSDAVAMLDVQYRMHPVIGALVGRLFYDGRLVHGADAARSFNDELRAGFHARRAGHRARRPPAVCARAIARPHGNRQAESLQSPFS